MKISIFVKLVGLVVFAVLLTGSALFVATSHYVSKTFDQKTQEDLGDIKGAIKSELKHLEKVLLDKGFLLANDLRVQQAMLEKNTPFLQAYGRQVLQQIGMDFLVFSNKDGQVIARGHSDRFGDSILGQVNVQKALAGESSVGIEPGALVKFSLRAGVPVKNDHPALTGTPPQEGKGGEIIGVVTLGYDLSTSAFVDEMKNRLGVEVSIFEKDTRVSSTIMRDGQRIVGTKMDNPQVLEAVLERSQAFFTPIELFGQSYNAAYWPIIDPQGQTAGMFAFAQAAHLAKEAAHSVQMSILWVSTIVGGLMLGGGVLLAQSLARPILKTTSFATRVAAGHLDEQLEIKNKDEIGTLAQALQAMVVSLKAKIQESERQAELAKQETQKAQAATQEADAAKQQVEMAHEGLLQAAGQLEGVVEQLTSASEQLAAQVEQASKGSEEQRSRTGETATAMEEMNATVLEVAKNASQAAQASDQARTKAADGAEVVSAAVSAIHKVQDQAQEMKSNIKQLGQQAEQIGRIMHVIEDIADQTNLLALNAAIEAARAGDAGRGFAVVADEVRRLAEKTMNSTKEVGEAILAIQSGTRANIQGMDQSVAAIAEATKLANRSGEALKEILTLAEQAADQVRSIAAAAEEQSATSEQIGRSVEDINRIASETSEVMDQSAQAISGLARQAQDLQSLVQQLKS
jgi:methyl-accepting chemotaxis protein